MSAVRLESHGNLVAHATINVTTSVTTANQERPEAMLGRLGSTEILETTGPTVWSGTIGTASILRGDQ